MEVGRPSPSRRVQDRQLLIDLRRALPTRTQHHPKLLERQVRSMDLFAVRVGDRSGRHLRRARKEDGMPVALGFQQQAQGPAGVCGDQDDRHFGHVVV